MDADAPGRHVTLGQFTSTFAPFAFLLSAAMMVPELPQIIEHHRAVYTIEALVYYRAIYSIWLTIAFMIPALALYFPARRLGQKEELLVALLDLWFLAYLVHFYYTVGVIFHWSFRDVYAKQGALIATSNFLDTAWWAFDLVLAWFVSSKAKWIRVQRTLAHIYIPATFFVSAVVIKHGVVRALGILMTASLLISIAIRLFKRKRGPVSITAHAA